MSNENVLKQGAVVLLVFLGFFLPTRSVAQEAVYVSSPLSHAIWKVWPDGSRSTFVSGLNSPTGLAFDRDGILCVAVADSAGGTIDKVDANGIAKPYISFPATSSGLDGLAFDASGNLYAAYWTNNGPGYTGGIYKITPDGNASIFASGFIPLEMAFDANGNLFAADQTDHTIREITPGGVASTFANAIANPRGGDGPWGLAFDSNGDLFFSQPGLAAIYEITTGGNIVKFSNVPEGPQGIAFDSQGNLMVAHLEYSGCFMSRIAPSGSISTVPTGISNASLNIADPAVKLPVPEPASVALLSLAGSALLARRRR